MDDSKEPAYYYLDAFKKIAAEFLLNEIIPIIARKGDSPEDRRSWARDVSFAMVSGILVKLAKRYPKNVDTFYEQAKQLARNMVEEDLVNYPEQYLPQRLPRWMGQLKELPKAKSRRTKDGDSAEKEYPLTKLQSLFQYEEILEVLTKIYAKRKNLSKEIIRNTLSSQFPDLPQHICKDATYQIKETAASKEDIAVMIGATLIGIKEESYKRHYLGGARKRAKKIDEGLQRYR